MSDKRRQVKYDSYRILRDAGVLVQKQNQIRFNAGSETFKHLLAKCCIGFLGTANDYWVASEVECANGFIDVLLWGNEGRLTYAVEAETAPTDESIQQKQECYVDGNPIDDLLVVDVSELPLNSMQALAYVSDRIGLEP